jgi:beta-glucanase (GH16 family)
MNLNTQFMKNLLMLIAFSILLTSTAAYCKKDSSRVVPDIFFNSTSISVSEDTPQGSVSIPVNLSAASGKKITVSYSVSDSTARSGIDYSSTGSGILVFEAGQTSKSITVNILADAGWTTDTYFKVTLSNPVNANIKGSGAKVRIINTDFETLVWSDEFDSSPLNSTAWNYELGASGWGNNELENYTNSINNVHIDSGYLHITALNPSANNYTSGRITTFGKHEFTYGRIEIRAKLPQGQGIWPALWMLGTNFQSVGWPACGEIDIMELLGHAPATVYGTLHWNSGGHQSRGSQYEIQNTTFSSGFHVFTLIWTPNYFKWLVDNTQYFALNKSEISGFPFDLPQFIIFNVAVGGNWPGNPNETTSFPQNMIVDYVRVYQ